MRVGHPYYGWVTAPVRTPFPVTPALGRQNPLPEAGGRLTVGAEHEIRWRTGHTKKGIPFLNLRFPGDLPEIRVRGEAEVQAWLDRYPALHQAVMSKQNPSRRRSYRKAMKAATGKGMNRYPWMALADTEAFVPLMERTGTSKVARSYRGFYTAFQKAEGVPKKMGRTHRDTPGRGDSYMWWERRNEFVSRHMGQVEKRGEKLWKPNGNPTKRHLGLIAWAYTPDPDGVDDWLARNAKKNRSTDLLGRFIPEKYLTGLTKKQRRARIRELTESREGWRGYTDLPTDIEARKKGLVKRSPYIVEAKRHLRDLSRSRRET